MSKNISSKSTGTSFIDFLSSHKEWVGAIAAVISAIFGLPQIFDKAKDNVWWTFLSIIGLLWLVLFWIYKRKIQREVWKGMDQQPKIETVFQYPKGRKWSFTGMIALPVLAVSFFAVVGYIERLPSGKTIILIADFQGPDQKFAVTQTIINRMKRATIEFPEVQITSLGEVIKEGTEHEAVRKIAAKRKASVI